MQISLELARLLWLQGRIITIVTNTDCIEWSNLDAPIFDNIIEWWYPEETTKYFVQASITCAKLG